MSNNPLPDATIPHDGQVLCTSWNGLTKIRPATIAIDDSDICYFVGSFLKVIQLPVFSVNRAIPERIVALSLSAENIF